MNTDNKTNNNNISSQNDTKNSEQASKPVSPQPSNSKEIGGRQHGLEPTRYGDWEFKGRCIDF